MNWDLKVALMKDGRPAWVVAAAAGLTPTTLSRIVRGHRAANCDERESLARELKRPVESLFPEPASQAA